MGQITKLRLNALTLKNLKPATVGCDLSTMYCSMVTCNCSKNSCGCSARCQITEKDWGCRGR